MGESPETPVRVSKIVNRTKVPAAQRRISGLRPASVSQGADEPNFAGRAVYRGESAETISFSRGISETAIAEFRFREVRDIMHGCLRAC